MLASSLPKPFLACPSFLCVVFSSLVQCVLHLTMEISVKWRLRVEIFSAVFVLFANQMLISNSGSSFEEKSLGVEKWTNSSLNTKSHETISRERERERVLLSHHFTVTETYIYNIGLLRILHIFIWKTANKNERYSLFSAWYSNYLSLEYANSSNSTKYGVESCE